MSRKEKSLTLCSGWRPRLILDPRSSAQNPGGSGKKALWRDFVKTFCSRQSPPSSAAPTASLLKRLPRWDLRAQIAHSPISEWCQQALPFIVEMSSPSCQSLELRTWHLENLTDWILSHPLTSSCDLGRVTRHLWEPSPCPQLGQARPFLSWWFVSMFSSDLCTCALRHLRDSRVSGSPLPQLQA